MDAGMVQLPDMVMPFWPISRTRESKGRSPGQSLQCIVSVKISETTASNSDSLSYLQPVS